jgi:hypothetical protein
MLTVLVLALTLAALVALPLLLVRLVIGVAFSLLMLPFKLLGLVLRITFGVVGVVFKILFSGLGLVFGLLAAVFVLVLVPLLPFVLIGLGVWLVVRQGRSTRTLRVA